MNEKIVVIAGDGSGVRDIHYGFGDWGLAWFVAWAPGGQYLAINWSPDGTRLAFQTDRDGNWEIYAVGIDGTGLVNLTRSPAQETGPRWR